MKKSVEYNWELIFSILSEWAKCSKAIEIMKEKKVNVLWLLESTSCYSFNSSIYKDHKLSRKEYLFLKEVFK